jgi:hypothetical protein
VTDKRYFKFTSLEEAHEWGIDPQHIVQHMFETVLCAFRGNEAGLDMGFYFSFRDDQRRSWTLSVIPEDGGVISDALLEQAQEEQS